MPVILVVAADAGSGQCQFFVYRSLVTIDALEILVFSLQLESGFIVVEIPVFPVARVMASVAGCTQCAFMDVLLLVTRKTIRLGILEFNG